SFLVATLAIFAHPAPFGTRPSVKKRSTRGLVKRWIATWIHHTLAQYTVSRYVHSGQHTDARPAPVVGGMERPFDPRRLRRPLSPRCVRSNARSCGVDSPHLRGGHPSNASKAGGPAHLLPTSELPSTARTHQAGTRRMADTRPRRRSARRRRTRDS